MSKYKFSVGQRVMYKGRAEIISDREKITPLHAFGNYYSLAITHLRIFKVSESELTAIEESK